MAETSGTRQYAEKRERVSVVFVCLGNICRSPLAEGFFQDLVERTGLSDRIEIDSAGTSNYHIGELPDRRAREAARRRGVELVSRARQLKRADLDRFDYVIVMDSENRRDVEQLGGGKSTARIQRLLDYADAYDVHDVPDPYYGGPEGFELVCDMVEHACARLLQHIREENGW